MSSIAGVLFLTFVLLPWALLLPVYLLSLLRRSLERWNELEDWTDVAGWGALLTVQLGLAGGNGLLLYLAAGVGL